MAHVALARKYRPQSFDEMVGQQAVVQTLKNSLATGKIHPAYIFSGIRGVGKTTAARLFAKGLNCSQGPKPTATPCGECPSCLEVGQARSMDVLEIDGATNTKAEEARDLVQAARYTPARDRYRVFIIDEVHMLSTAAFNALLKTLEEPPPHAVFLLATTEPHRIPETIHSRAQHFQLRAVAPHVVAGYLKEVCAREKLEASDGALELVARAGEGSVRDSLTLLDRLASYASGPITEELAAEALGLAGPDALRSLLQILGSGKVEKIPAFVDKLLERGTDVDRFLGDLEEAVRELGRLRFAPADSPAPSLGEQGKELAALFTPEELLRLWDLVAATRQRLKGAPDPDSLLELQLIKAAMLPRILPLEALLPALAAQAGALAAPAAPPPSRPQPEEEKEPPSAAVSEGLRFKALIPFSRMDESEAQTYEAKDPRAGRFRAEAAKKMPLAAHTLEQAELSLDPDGVLHIALPPAATTGAVLLSTKERKEALEAAASLAGYPGPVVVENGTRAPEPELPPRQEAMGRPEESDAVKNVLRVFGGQIIQVTPLSPESPPGGDHGEPE
jgi:DNA polymerase-3 subunit gamma/tau